ncbi:MAG: enoyl-CoA hydratase/isomerase family protein [Candidatus Binatia bacterium]
MPENFLFAHEGQMATITFYRPERRNCITAEFFRELEHLLVQVRDNDDIRVLIVTGSGPAFSAGADVGGAKTLQDSQERMKKFAEDIKTFPRLNGRVLEAFLRLDALTIAAVNGFAVGGGWALAGVMDFVVAAETAEFWIPEIELGIPFLGLQTEILARRAGQWLAKDIMLLGRHFSAEELLRLGMITRVVKPDQLMAETRAFAQKLLTLPKKPITLTKHAINAVFSGPRLY